MGVTRVQYWLYKSEPTDYSYRDLQRDGRTDWTGVRNYQARNFLREAKPGDLVLFYHSNTKVIGVYGVAKVVSEPYPDRTQFDPNSVYYDPKATEDEPRWSLVDIEPVQQFAEPVTLAAIKADTHMPEFALTQRGNRLSVMPVPEAAFQRIVELGEGS